MPLDIADEDIGGARVRMGFNTFRPDGSQYRYKAGEHLTPAEVRAMPLANRRSLSSAGFIEIYPTRTEVVRRDAPAGKQERFIVQVRKDQYNVIEGRKLNDQPLTREQAETLAASANK